MFVFCVNLFEFAFNLFKIGKLYASSAFYSPTLHPTVEDQVELARRISHSLSDISNQTSKGQTMYVNRKKRSVKWVHEGCGQGKNKEYRYLLDACIYYLYVKVLHRYVTETSTLGNIF